MDFTALNRPSTPVRPNTPSLRYAVFNTHVS